MEWLDPGAYTTLIGLSLAVVITAWTVLQTRLGRAYQMREIAGLKAIDDAIGRATEMGKPVLFTPGYGGDIQRPTTIASMSLLSAVAEKCANYDCRLIYPTHDPIILATAQEVVRQAAVKSGHPERYRAQDLQYFSSSQFAYAAGVEGEIVREQPGSVFLLGTFEAESLILAEAAASAGAIQIAGTDSTIQLAFFMIACDYTLLGEELFAASGYISGNRDALASVWAQDWLRIVCGVFVLVALLSALFAPELTWWK